MVALYLSLLFRDLRQTQKENPSASVGRGLLRVISPRVLAWSLGAVGRNEKRYLSYAIPGVNQPRALRSTLQGGSFQRVMGELSGVFRNLDEVALGVADLLDF